MVSEVKANKMSPASGTAVTLGDSGDTFTVPSGATIVNSGTATGFGAVLQVKQFRKLSTILEAGTSATVLAAPFNGSATITPASSANYIGVEFVTSMDHGTNWRSGHNILEWSADGGSTYYGLSGGSYSSGSNAAAMQGNSFMLGGIFNPNVTIAVKVRVVIDGHSGGWGRRHGQYNNQGEDGSSTTPDTTNSVIAVGHYLILTEYTGSVCSTADTA